MRKSTAQTFRMVAGLDLGDRYSQFCILDPDGEVVEEGRIATTKQALRRKFEGAEPMLVVLEVGTHSPWEEPHLLRGRRAGAHAEDAQEGGLERGEALLRSDRSPLPVTSNPVVTEISS
jgi:hypothetical protein